MDEVAGDVNANNSANAYNNANANAYSNDSAIGGGNAGGAVGNGGGYGGYGGGYGGNSDSNGGGHSGGYNGNGGNGGNGIGGRAARFYGNFKNSLDAKGRVFIPAKFREGLGTYFTLTKGFDACLVIYTMQDWETISELLESIPSTDREGREFKRHFFGNAIDCEMDKQGRIGISQDLREYARLTGDIGFIGMGKRIELWNWENWKANNSTYGDNAEVLSKAAQKYLAGKAAVL